MWIEILKDLIGHIYVEGMEEIGNGGLLVIQRIFISYVHRASTICINCTY